VIPPRRLREGKKGKAEGEREAETSKYMIGEKRKGRGDKKI
jgi:hypothetical protein